ncbi:MAG: hypothetical protein Q4C82_03030 [Eubacteriales bacterium]|nr:hypothetical protein [Eubacteriales bacterium]
MKILLISYDSFPYDGRLRELIKVAKELGETTYITRGGGEEQSQEPGHLLYQGGGYLGFLRFCAREAARLGKTDLIFIDNRKGILPGYLAKRLTRADYVVQDCRELYDMKSAAGVAGRIGCLVEKLFTRHSDVVVAANAFRAKLMVRMFGLRKTPLSYENIRRLTNTSEEKRRQTEEECRTFFEEEKFRIVSTAGCDMSRTTGRMLEAMKGLGEGFELLLIGESDEEDEEIVRQTILQNGLTNVKILPRMDQDHLKYFIDSSQIGLVTYHQRDLNNKYCASGKIFEFLFEGKPVVTSTNPPLKEFCEKYRVGVADDDYERAIRTAAAQYGQLQKTVEEFVSRVHVERNNHRLAEKIRRELEGRQA